MLWLQIGFLVAALLAAYFIWTRPLLKQRPAFAEVFAFTETRWGAIKLKLAGLKVKLASAVGMAGSLIVLLNDSLAPIAAGVDWTPIRELLPPWAWPLILFAGFWVISRLRAASDVKEEAAVESIATAIDLQRPEVATIDQASAVAVAVREVRASGVVAAPMAQAMADVQATAE